MIVKATDSGIRNTRKGDVDTASYFFRALVVHNGEEKLIAVWDCKKEKAKTQFDQEMSALRGER